MVLCNTLNNSIGYSEFLKYLDSGGWALSIGINDRMTIDEHISFIYRITQDKDLSIEFIPDDAIPKLVEKNRCLHQTSEKRIRNNIKD